MEPDRPAVVHGETGSEQTGGALFRFDPGWLYLVSGVLLVGATVLIPAIDDLTQARFGRDRARAVATYHTERLERYSGFIDALDRAEPALLLSLAQTQLNLAPAGKRPLIDISRAGQPSSASVFPALEPVYTPAREPERPRTLLQRSTTSDRPRLWLIALGMMLILIGVLPPTRASGEPAPA